MRFSHEPLARKFGQPLPTFTTLNRVTLPHLNGWSYSNNTHEDRTCHITESYNWFQINYLPYSYVLFLFPEKLHLKRNSLYNGVESFVLFVGYPRSGHSLVGAILDSHPEIIIPHEFDLLTKFNRFFNDPNEESRGRRLRIFSKLHTVSRRQAMFGNRSPNYTLGYSYHIPGSWQGKYRNGIKVSVRSLS